MKRTVFVKRRVFFSFQYEPDVWRAAQVRKIGALEGNASVSDNDWEQVKRGGDSAIKRWISREMRNRTCTVVLVGSNTANRKWINYEIVKSWNDGMGVVGIHIHGLKDRKGMKSSKGRNPFDFVDVSGRHLSTIVKCYDPDDYNARCYQWISEHLAHAVEKAISIRRGYSLYYPRQHDASTLRWR